MIGSNASSLAAIDTRDHLVQSVRTILETPVGSRVMRRDFGSNLHKLIDEPVNDATKMAARVATVEALLKWEPRIAIDRVSVELAEGRISISIDAQVLDSREYVQLDAAIARGRVAA